MLTYWCVHVCVLHLRCRPWCPNRCLFLPRWSSWSCRSEQMGKRGRERSRVVEMYNMRKGKSHFPVIRLTPISGFKCHIMWSLCQPALLNVSHSPCELKKHGGQEGRKRCARAQMKRLDWSGAAVASLVPGCWLSTSHPWPWTCC